MFQSLSDSFVKWEPYCGELIVERFSNEEWKLMVSDICSDEEWKSFLDCYSDFLRCYILRDVSKNKEIAFVYLYNELHDFRVVSIHGGGWDRSIHLSLLYYRGLILLIYELLKQERKVHTSCMCQNIHAYRFLQSIGFVKYLTTDKAHYMWINEKRLKNSRIYRRIYAKGYVGILDSK